MVNYNDGIYTSQIRQEENQDHRTRAPIYEELEEKLGGSVISFYTSFTHPVSINDRDVGMLEDLLNSTPIDDELYIIINSPGGSALAAERIINVCRSYSPNSGYNVIVPDQAKSAATMVCLGSKKIVASETSELGPVGPQLPASSDSPIKRYNVRRLVESYHDIFEESLNTDGHLEPYLQQLENYDERDISEYEAQLELAEEISVQALQESMMPDKDEDEIQDCIEMFLTPEETKDHGRPIYIDDMDECGLNVDRKNLDSDLWDTVRELHIRLNNYVSSNASKAMEGKSGSFVIAAKETDQ